TGARAVPVPVGYRPMPRDGFPVLGFPEPVPNLYIALMHSGVTLAPLVGELAALEIVDGARVQILNAYRPERFLGPGPHPGIPVLAYHTQAPAARAAGALIHARRR